MELQQKVLATKEACPVSITLLVNIWSIHQPDFR